MRASSALWPGAMVPRMMMPSVSPCDLLGVLGGIETAHDPRRDELLADVGDPEVLIAIAGRVVEDDEDALLLCGADGVVELGGVDPGEADGHRFGGDGVELYCSVATSSCFGGPIHWVSQPASAPNCFETGAHRDEEGIVVVGDENDLVVSLLPPRRGEARPRRSGRPAAAPMPSAPPRVKTSRRESVIATPPDWLIDYSLSLVADGLQGDCSLRSRCQRTDRSITDSRSHLPLSPDQPVAVAVPPPFASAPTALAGGAR